MISQEKLKSLKDEAKSIKASIAIGKEGLKDTIINQIKLYVKANKICKVKLSRAFLDAQEMSKKDLAQKITELTNTTLITQIGNVVVVYKN